MRSSCSRTWGLVSGSASTTVANASSWSDNAASVWARTSCSSRARWLRSASNSARLRSTSARSDASSSLVICSACSTAWRRVIPTITAVNTAASPPQTTAKLLPLASVATRTATTPTAPTPIAGIMRQREAAASVATPGKIKATGEKAASAPPAAETTTRQAATTGSGLALRTRTQAIHATAAIASRTTAATF